jgi:hypothetical protein
VHLDAAGRASELAAVLAGAGLGDCSINQITPSIEDLFVALLEHEQRGPAS